MVPDRISQVVQACSSPLEENYMPSLLGGNFFIWPPLSSHFPHQAYLGRWDGTKHVLCKNHPQLPQLPCSNHTTHRLFEMVCFASLFYPSLLFTQVPIESHWWLISQFLPPQNRKTNWRYQPTSRLVVLFAFFPLIYFGQIHLNSSLSAQHLGINGPTKLVIVDCQNQMIHFGCCS